MTRDRKEPRNLPELKRLELRTLMGAAMVVARVNNGELDPSSPEALRANEMFKDFVDGKIFKNVLKIPS